MNKEELKLKAKVDEYFEKYMCVSFDKFIENWEELEQLFQDQNQLLIKKDKEIDNLNKQLKWDYQEINRLRNIIDELEKWCLSWKENDKYCYLASNDKDKCRYDIWEEVLDKLKELKEGNNGNNRL